MFRGLAECLAVTCPFVFLPRGLPSQATLTQSTTCNSSFSAEQLQHRARSLPIEKHTTYSTNKQQEEKHKTLLFYVAVSHIDSVRRRMTSV